MSAEQQNEMEGLIELVDHQMQLRSEALLLLKQRGCDIRKYLQPGPQQMARVAEDLR